MTASTGNEMIDGFGDDAQRLWELTVEVWNTSFLGASVGQGVAALLILVVGVLARGLIARWLIGFFRRMAAKSETEIDDKIVDALGSPIKLVPIAVSLYFAMQVLGLEGEGTNGERIVQSLIAITIFWALHNAVLPVAELIKPLQRAFTPVMIDWMIKFLRVLILIIGVGAVLEIWGIPVGPIIAGLGLFGVAVGLGAQDLFKNLIAGILILTERRFLPGDWVKVDGVVEGTVEQINFRSTLVRRFDKGPVYVPNSKLSDNAVINFSRMTHRRIYWVIGVRYDATTEQLKEIRDKVLDYVLTHPEFAHPPEVSTFMRVDRFSDSSIDFMLYCFTRTTNWGEWLRIKEELALVIKQIVADAGTDFAFPTTSIVLEGGAERFEVPDQ
jgi:MscS family membrane protein